jgi:hypothetical protein
VHTQPNEVTKVGIFRRHERDDVVTQDDGNDVVTRDEPVARDRVVADRRGDWSGPPLVRAIFTLLGVAAAGLLIWLASFFDVTSTSEFWAAMGLIAAAGLALGFSQLFGGWTKWGIPIVSPGVFLLAFIPTAVVVGWILLATQPEGGWQHDRLAGWSSDIGITGLVNDLGTYSAALAMGLGIVFAFSFDTTGPRRREVIDREREIVPDEDVHDYNRDITTTAPVGEGATVPTREKVPATDGSGDRVEIRDPSRGETT